MSLVSVSQAARKAVWGEHQVACSEIRPQVRHKDVPIILALPGPTTWSQQSSTLSWLRGPGPATAGWDNSALPTLFLLIRRRRAGSHHLHRDSQIIERKTLHQRATAIGRCVCIGPKSAGQRIQTGFHRWRLARRHAGRHCRAGGARLFRLAF